MSIGKLTPCSPHIPSYEWEISTLWVFGGSRTQSHDSTTPVTCFTKNLKLLKSSEVTDGDGWATSGGALKTTTPELTHLRILWDLKQEENHQQGG
ncbi:hypothetical protein TNCV_96981 [Trichonephila clavipes]|nr:hypothetical protein TNCV_96981 [Trichonephila clavipes]